LGSFDQSVSPCSSLDIRSSQRFLKRRIGGVLSDNSNLSFKFARKFSQLCSIAIGG
jgi:hypothetical protein